MRIGIDGTVLSYNKEGIGHYVRALLKELIHSKEKGLEFTLFLNEDGFGKKTSALDKELQKALKAAKNWQVEKVRASFKLAPGVLTVKEVAKRATELKLDLMLSTHSHLLPIAFKPTFWLVHDISPIIHPEYFFPKRRLYSPKGIIAAAKNKTFKGLFRRGMINATKIITTSKFVGEEIEKHYPETAGKIGIIGAGPSEWTKSKLDRKQALKLLEKYNLRSENYFLNVGTLSPRKNVELLLQGYVQFIIDHKLEKPTLPKLLIVGKKGWLYEPIFAAFEELKREHSDLDLKAMIRFADYLPDEDLKGLAQKSLALVYPSKYEGFGLPLLEGLLLKREVIASDIPVFKELYKGLAHFFKLEDAKAEGKAQDESHRKSAHNLAQKLRDVYNGKTLNDPEKLKKLIAKYSWSETANNLIKLIKDQRPDATVKSN